MRGVGPWLAAQPKALVSERVWSLDPIRRGKDSLLAGVYRHLVVNLSARQTDSHIGRSGLAQTGLLICYSHADILGEALWGNASRLRNDQTD